MADELQPGPARTQDSSDWRFAVLVLLVLVLATLATSVVLYVKETTIPEGIPTLGGGLVGALIVIIGKRTIGGAD